MTANLSVAASMTAGATATTAAVASSTVRALASRAVMRVSSVARTAARFWAWVRAADLPPDWTVDQVADHLIESCGAEASEDDIALIVLKHHA